MKTIHTRSFLLAVVVLLGYSESARTWAQLPDHEASRPDIDGQVRQPASSRGFVRSPAYEPFQAGGQPTASAATTRLSRTQTPQPLKLKNPDRQDDISSSEPSTKRGSGSITTTIVALVFVILLIFVTAKVLKKHVPVRMAGIPSEALEVLGKQHLDRRQAIYLVRCGSRILILGSSSDRLNILAEVSDPIEIDYLSGLCRHDDKDVGVIRTFRELLNNYRPARENNHRSDSQSIASSLNRGSKDRIEPAAGFQRERKS